MNSRYINIILLLCFCGVLLVYYQKSERTNDHVDYTEKSLAGLKKILSPTARLKYYGLKLDPLNGRENYPLARYVLVPVTLEPATDMSFRDSTLLLFRNDADSTIRYIHETTDIIWENRDSVYHYLLIKERK
jgi:hypothetical protein